ncbi:hypothetical protein [Kribbella endophytica]
MNETSLAGWTTQASVPELEITRKERRRIWWQAVRDRVRYREVPLGDATNWTHEQNQLYAGFAQGLRKQLKDQEKRLLAERAEQDSVLREAPEPVAGSPRRPDGDPRNLHEWSIHRRAELRALANEHRKALARSGAASRIAAIDAELGGMPEEFATLRSLCESAYLVRVEIYNRHRCSRADRKVSQVPVGPPFEGPDWGSRQPYLTTVQTRSA